MHDSTIQEQSILLPCALEWREDTRRRHLSSCNIDIEFNCFLCVYNQIIENQRRFARLQSETHIVASDTWNSNELFHQFLDRQGHGNSTPISIVFLLQRLPCDILKSKNIIPIPFVDFLLMYSPTTATPALAPCPAPAALRQYHSQCIPTFP